MGRAARLAAPLLLSAFSIMAVSQFNDHIVDSTIELSRYRAVLDNTFQSTRAGAASFQMLTDFTSRTPFQIDEVAGSFTKLVNRGLVPTKMQMMQLGDVAASQGKSFDQYVEAVLDAQTSEFERLKEFGIKAKSNGQTVALTFKGQTTEIKNTGDAIADYLIQIGQMDGVRGSMGSIAQTLGGMLSNLRDKFTLFSYGLGQQLMPLYSFFIDKLGAAIDWVSSRDFSPLINSITSGVMTAYNVASSFLGFIASHATVFKGFLLGVVAYKGYLTVMAVRQSILAISSLKLAVAMNAIPIFAIITGITMLITLVVHAYKKVGWFRGAVDAAGAAIKGFAIALKDHVIARFKAMITGITGIGRAIKLIFKGEFSEAVKAGKQAISDLAGVSARKKFASDMRQVGVDSARAYAEGFVKAEKNNSGGLFKMKAPGEKMDYEKIMAQYRNQGGSPGGLALAGAGSGGTRGVSSVVGSGGRQINQNISIGSLIDQLQLNTTNIQEGVEDLEKVILEAILRVLNSVGQRQ